VAKSERLYTNIRLLTKKKPGKKETFAFTGNIVFLSDDGRVVGEEMMSAKQSCKRTFAVPETAGEALFIVDCRCLGTFDLAIPHFSTEKERIKKR
jgi:predicted phosphoribosyltransferase